jgi:hypothetical protein
MSAQFDFDQLLDSWLADGPSELPDQAVSRIVQSLDDNERRLSWLPRRETMNRFVVAAGSVAAIVLVAVIGFGIVSGGGTSGLGGAPSPTPSPTQAPSKLTGGAVEPGRYFYEVDGFRYTFTIPESGWTFDPAAGGVYQGEDSELAIFWPGGDMTDLYRRACVSSGTEFDPGPSVEDLANALASLEDFEVTAPADVTVSGYEGKRVAVTVPMDVNVNSPACHGENYRLSPGRWYQAPGQTDDMRILDLDGERQTIVVSNTPATPADVAAQLEAMVASMEIEPR